MSHRLGPERGMNVEKGGMDEAPDLICGSILNTAQQEPPHRGFSRRSPSSDALPLSAH